MQRIITRSPFESDKRVEFNWWLKDEVICDYCIYKTTRTCNYCAYNRKRRFSLF